MDCGHCGTHGIELDEMEEEEAIRLVADLARLGTRLIIFSGGEPLLRQDLGNILKTCRRHGIRTLLKSNGVDFFNRLSTDITADEVHFSLDGPRDLHDDLRGRGVFDDVVDAVDICHDRGVSVSLVTVMTAYNLDRLTELLDEADHHDVGVCFQPMDTALAPPDGSAERFVPDPVNLRRAVGRLLEEKRHRRTSVLNSVSGLRRLQRWPDTTTVHCVANRFTCTIDPDGRVFLCDMFPDYERYLVAPEHDLGATLQTLELPHPCPRCPTGSMLDLNLAASGHLDSILSIARRLLKN